MKKLLEQYASIKAQIDSIAEQILEEYGKKIGTTGLDLKGVEIEQYINFIDWVICGCESGPGARPMRLSWANLLLDQCRNNLTPFFFKQAVIDCELTKMPKLLGKVWGQYPR